jgi:hypothetical protein
LDSALHNTARKPAPRTTAQAVQAGKAVESKTTKTAKEIEAKVQAFKGVSCAHEFGNLSMDLLALINNKDKMHFNEARQAAHKKIKRGQFTGYSTHLNYTHVNIIDIHYICICQYN